MYSLWKCMNWIGPLKKNLGLFVLRYALWVVLIFAAGTILFLIYLQLVKLIRFIWKCCKKQTVEETKS